MKVVAADVIAIWEKANITTIAHYSVINKMGKLVARAQEMEKIILPLDEKPLLFKQQNNRFRPLLTFVLGNALGMESQIETSAFVKRKCLELSGIFR